MSTASPKVYQITRNGVTLNFREATNRKGLIYWKPDLQKESREIVDKFFEDVVLDRLQAFISQLSQATVQKLTEDADGNPIPFDENLYIENMQNFSVSGPTLEDLEDKEKELTDSFIKLNENPGETFLADMAAIAKELKSIKEQIETKREIYKARAAKRKDRQPAEASASEAVAA